MHPNLIEPGKMKKFVLTSIFFMTVITFALAVKIKPGPRLMTQSDGTIITVYGYGDENMHYYMTSDNILLYNSGSNFYIAKIDSTNGVLSSTGILAHNYGHRSKEEAMAIGKQNTNYFFNAKPIEHVNSKKLYENIANNSTYFPHTGTPKALVILVQFSDTIFKIKNPKYIFDKYLNATSFDEKRDGTLALNYGSVAQYFSDMSGGRFRPQFDVYGPVTLQHPSSYYGSGDDNIENLIPDACKAVDDSVDFSKYDANGDGKVDLLYIIYAGYSQSITSYSDDLWPKSGTNGSFGYYDGKQVYRYGINNELNYTWKGYMNDHKTYINGIGLFCHEFSHCMGMPDTYSTTSPANKLDNQEMEMWDLMDGGEYTNNGYCPTPYTAWEKESMGWIKIDTLKTPSNITMLPLNEGGKAYKIINDAASNEYYTLENIQNTGWNSSAYGHGLLISHVNYIPSYFYLGQSPNNIPGKPYMTVFPADGILYNISNTTISSDEYYISHAGDPFPGTSKTTSFTDTTTIIKSIVYNGATGYMSKPITNIAEAADGTITFRFMGGDTNSIENAIIDNNKEDNKIYSTNGMYLGTNMSILPKGIYIINRKKIIK